MFPSKTYRVQGRPASRSGAMLLLLCALLLSMGAPGLAAGAPPAQTFYIPMPEDQILAALRGIYPGGSAAFCNNFASDVLEPVNTYVSVAAIADGTVIYYDQWEDGFEPVINAPGQATTQIWGDGNLTNGIAPGTADDLIHAGAVLILDNGVQTATRQSVIDFDGGDKLAATKTVAMTRAAWGTGSSTLLAGAVEVYDTNSWGTQFRSPVGETTSPVSLFEYSGLLIMAAQNGTVVNVDRDNNGSAETTVTLNEGESAHINGGVLAGGTVNASKPVQVQLITGDRCETYESRWFVLTPVEQWGSSYYNPVGTPAGDGTVVFVHNPNPATITVRWETSGGLQPPLSVAAGSTANVTTPAGSGSHFFTNDGSRFFAIAAVDADGPANTNAKADWGFTLLADDAVTPQVLIGWGPGRDPLSLVNPAENGSPVWVMPVFPAGASGSINVCADYNGDGAGALTDPQGNKYDQLLTLAPFQSAKIFDSDGDQTAMVIYVCRATGQASGVGLAAAWGQDPSTASAAAPGLDLGTTAPPSPSFGAGKGFELINDVDGDGLNSPGDVIGYTIVIRNSSRVPVPDVVVSDTIPLYTKYVLNSTTFDSGSGPTPIADKLTGTAFPLDEGGINVGTVAATDVFTVSFRVTVDNPLPVGVDRIINQGKVLALGEERTPTVIIPMDLDPSLTMNKLTVGQDADTPTGPILRTGAPVTWSYIVTNTSQVTLTNVVMTDSVAGVNPVLIAGDTDSDNALAPTEIWTFRAVGTATTGQYANVGTVRADWVDGTGITDTVTASDPSHYFGLFSQVRAVKETASSVVYAGTSVVYTYTVINLGNGPLADVTATDDHCAPLVYTAGDTNSNDLLDVTESWVYTCTAVLNTATTNTVTLGGTDLLGDAVSDQASASVTTIAPAIGLSKVAAPVIVAPGQAVTYTFTVTNAGDDPLGTIILTDDQCAPVLFEGGDLNGDTLLDLSERWVYTCSAPASADLTNVATVSGVDSLGGPVSAQASANVNVISPVIGLAKVVSPATIYAGQAVTYTFTVTNPGDDPLGNIVLTDNQCAPVSFGGGDLNSNSVLDLGESWHYTCSTSVAADLTNTATVSGTDSLGSQVSAQASAVVNVINPAIGLSKSAAPATIYAGQVVTFTFTVTNAGDDPLSGIALSDDRCGPVSFVSGDLNNDTLLDLGESWVYTCSTSVSADLTNIATVTGTDSLGGDVSAQASANVDVIRPAIGLAKTASASVIHAGTTVTYTFTVTNAGDVPLANVGVSDDKCAPVLFGGGDGNGNTLLDLTETWTFTCSVALNADTLNTATATGTDPLGGSVSDQAAAQVDVINPGLSVTKTASAVQVYAGETVRFTYTVINTGDTPLSNITAADDRCAPVSFVGGDSNSDTKLDLTETWTFICSAALTQTTTNTITVTGQDALGGSTGDTDSVTVTVLAFGSIGDRVWMDVNRNGIQDAGEPGMADVGVVLLTGGGTVAGTTFTNGSGNFRFDGLRAGTYQLSFTRPSGSVFTAANQGSDDNTDSDANRVTGRTAIINLAAGQTDLSWDAGMTEPLLFLPLIMAPPHPPTPTPTSTSTPTPTPTFTPTSTPTPTVTPTPSPTPIFCPPPGGCTIELLAHPKGLAVHTALNRLFIASRDNDQLLVVNGQTNQLIASAPTGDEPWGVVVNESTNRVYVSNYASGDLWIYNATTLAVEKKITLGVHPALVEILPALDTVFVAIRSSGKIGVIQGTTLLGLFDSGGSGPYGLAADTLNNRLYISNRDSGHLAALVQSGGTWAVRNGPLLNDGRTLFDMAYSPATNKIYIVYAKPHDPTGTDWLVDVWKPDVNSPWALLQTIPVGDGGAVDSPQVGGTGIVVNPVTGNVFNVNTAAGTMSVIHGQNDYVKTTVALGTDPYTIAIDPVRNFIYIALRGSGSVIKVQDGY